MSCAGCKRRREKLKQWLKDHPGHADNPVVRVSLKTVRDTVSRIRPSQTGLNTVKSQDTSEGMAPGGTSSGS